MEEDGGCLQIRSGTDEKESGEASEKLANIGALYEIGMKMQAIPRAFTPWCLAVMRRNPTR